MSAFVVSKKHIDAMLTFGLSCGELTWRLPGAKFAGEYEKGQPWGPAAIAVHEEYFRTLLEENATRIGQMLWDENYLSVNHRYDKEQQSQIYEFSWYKGKLESLQILKAINCYEYQTCEHLGWEDSEAYAFCDALRRLAIYHLPRYNKMIWEIE